MLSVRGLFSSASSVLAQPSFQDLTMGAHPVGQRGEASVDGEADHQLKFNTQTLLRDIMVIFQMGGKKDT